MLRSILLINVLIQYYSVGSFQHLSFSAKRFPIALLQGSNQSLSLVQTVNEVKKTP